MLSVPDEPVSFSSNTLSFGDVARESSESDVGSTESDFKGGVTISETTSVFSVDVSKILLERYFLNDGESFLFFKFLFIFIII